MIIDKQTVYKVADLARIAVKDEDIDHLTQEMNKVLTFMEKLNELDTTGVEPLVFVNEDVNVFRDDVVNYPITKEEVLMTAPITDADYFKVPKFVKGTKY